MKKNFLHILSLAIASVCMSSCHFLEVEKIGKSDIESYFSDVYALEGAVYGLSSLTYKYYDNYFILYPEITGDMVKYSSTYNTHLPQYNYISRESEETTMVGYLWKSGYEILTNANEIIYFGPKLLKEYPELSSRINTAVAQAYFIRALLHLDLSLAYAQHYTYTSDAGHLGIAIMNRVPGVTEKISRSSMAVTYSQIVTDLKDALKIFPEGYSNTWLPSPAACKALLARVSLYMGRYTEAASYASEVISSYGFSLTPREKYTAMFCNVDTKGEEAIYRLSGVRQSSVLSSTFGYKDVKIYPSAKLLSIFSEDENQEHPDIRKSLLSYNGKDGESYQGVCMKYTITDDIADNVKYVSPFVLRLSEMYLIRAEANCAANNTDAAADDIAELIARATGVDKKTAKPAFSNAAELEKIIQRERIKELFLEGHRQFDITRRKENLERDESTNSTVRTIKYPDDRFILPIPLVELDANKNMQSNPVNDTRQ